MPWSMIRIALLLPLVLSGCVGQRGDLMVSFPLPPFLLAECLFGGVAVWNDKDFEGREICSATGEHEASIDLKSDSFQLWVPFIVHYYHQGRPYSIHVQAYDQTGEYQSIEVDEVILNYANGDVVRKQVHWKGELTPHVFKNCSDKYSVESDVREWSQELDGLVRKHSDVTITLKGCRIKASGERVPFVSWRSFEAIKSKMIITTYWQVVNSV